MMFARQIEKLTALFWSIRMKRMFLECQTEEVLLILDRMLLNIHGTP